jgi:hypothetical protein
MLSCTEQADQLSTSRDVLTVVGKINDRATAGGRTSSRLRSSEVGRSCAQHLPFVARRLPLLCSSRTRNSSLASVTYFRNRAISEVVLSKAIPHRSIQRFTGVSRVEERTIVLTSGIASRNSVPSGGEPSNREQSRLFGVVIGSGVVGEVGEGIRRVERIVIGLRGLDIGHSKRRLNVSRCKSLSPGRNIGLGPLNS